MVFSNKNINFFDLKIENFFQQLFKIIKHIKKSRPDIIHAHMFHGLVIGIIFKIINFRIKIVFTSHNFNAGQNPLRKIFIILSKPFRNADIVFSNKQHTDLNIKNTNVIFNGVDSAVNSISHIDENNQINSKKYKLLAVGSLTKQKNFANLVFEIAGVLKSQDAILDIYGEGPEREKIESAILTTNAEKNVFLKGISSTISKDMSGYDLFIISSIYEGFPLVLIEAGMNKLPILSTNVGAIDEILTDENGWCVEFNEFKRTLMHIIENNEERRTRAKLFHRFAMENCTLAAMIKKHKEVYNQLI